MTTEVSQVPGSTSDEPAEASANAGRRRAVGMVLC
jgi:hypothetical protein